MPLSVRDVARILSIPEATVHQLIAEKNLPARKVNQQTFFNPSELLEWATLNQIPVSPELFKDASLPTLTEALGKGTVDHGIKGQDKPSVFKAILHALPLPKEVDKAFLLSVLLSRENVGSTAIGHGIAIPHVRNPIVLAPDQTILHLYFLENPIPFDAPDGKPVHALFLLFSPTVRAHLQMLAALSHALKNESFRQAVERQADRKTLLLALAQAEGIKPAKAPKRKGKP